MAARIRKGTADGGWPQQVRDRIQTSMLINRLTDHALGKCDLQPTQVKSIEILLRKTIPDLAATAITVTDNRSLNEYSTAELLQLVDGISEGGGQRVIEAQAITVEPDQVY